MITEIYAQELRDIHSPFTYQDRFAFNPNKPHRRLQLLALWILRKLGCNAINDIVTFTSISIDHDDLTKFIHKHIDNLYSQREQIDRIVIGSKQFYELCHSKELFHSLNPNLGFYGIPIQVVPWIDGCFAIPKL